MLCSINRFIRIFWSSYVVTFLALLLGYHEALMAGVILTASITAVEIIFSFDNAVVNATILKHWDQKWRNIFMWVGLPIAVFGMRFVFPLLIVSTISGLGMVDTFHLALNDPAKYASTLTSAHHDIVAFGGTFLLLVGLNFFTNHEKSTHWVTGIEEKLAGIHPIYKYVITAAVLAIMSVILHSSHFFIVGLAGAGVFIALELLHHFMGDGAGEAGGAVVKQGIIGLLYLEILDASFSFDGVIGAFALTNNIWIIAASLGAGAMFVRSFTLLMVDKGTLDTYRYMENGAFTAILALVAMMFVGLFAHVSEVIMAGVSGAIVIAAIVHSVLENKSDAESTPVV